MATISSLVLDEVQVHHGKCANWIDKQEVELLGVGTVA